MLFLKLGIVAIVLVAIVVGLFSINLFFKKEVRIHEGSCSTNSDHEKDKGIGCCGGGCDR
jgi:hypothetical protein